MTGAISLSIGLLFLGYYVYLAWTRPEALKKMMRNWGFPNWYLTDDYIWMTRFFGPIAMLLWIIVILFSIIKL